jgi:hypothetical protein
VVFGRRISSDVVVDAMVLPLENLHILISEKWSLSISSLCSFLFTLDDLMMNI